MCGVIVFHIMISLKIKVKMYKRTNLRVKMFLNSSRKGIQNDNLPSIVTFLFFLYHSNHHQDLMDNFY